MAYWEKFHFFYQIGLESPLLQNTLLI